MRERRFEGTQIGCAYAADDASPYARSSASTLVATLPRYMLPTRWLELDVLPKNANGKIDRKEIQRLFATQQVEPSRP